MTRDKGCVVITGAQSGIGRSIALKASDCGYLTVRLGRKSGPNVDIATDLNDESALARACLQIISRGDPIVGLIYCAADVFPGSLLSSRANLKTEFMVNAIAPFELIRHLSENLIASNARIFLIGSTASSFPIPNLAGYSASKGAMAHLAVSLREELKGSGVSVTIVEPPNTRTNLWNKISARLQSEPGQLSSLSDKEAEALLTNALPIIEQTCQTADAVAEKIMSSFEVGRRRAKLRIGVEAQFAGMLSGFSTFDSRRQLVRFALRQAGSTASRSSR